MFSKFFLSFIFLLSLNVPDLCAQFTYPILSHSDYKRLYPLIHQTKAIPFPLSVFADSWRNHIHVKNPKLYNTFTLIKGLIEWNNFWQHLGDTAETILLPLPDANWKGHVLLAIIGPPAQKEVVSIPGIPSAFLSWPDENIEIQKSAISSSFGITLLTIDFSIIKKPWLDKTTFAPHIKYEYAPITILRLPWDYSQYIAVVENQVEVNATPNQSIGPRIKSKGR